MLRYFGQPNIFRNKTVFGLAILSKLEYGIEIQVSTHLLFSVFSCAVTLTSWDSFPAFSSLSSTVFALELGVRAWKKEAAKAYRN